MAHHVSGQLGMDVVTEYVPPVSEVFGQMSLFGWWIGTFAAWIKGDQPRLQFADEVENFHVLAESETQTRKHIINTNFDVVSVALCVLGEASLFERR